jgi:hypothetical protein
MVGQEISKDNAHQYVHGRRITDDGRDLVTDCNDQLSQSSPDDFSLPHGFLLCSTMCVRLPHWTVWNEIHYNLGQLRGDNDAHPDRKEAVPAAFLTSVISF